MTNDICVTLLFLMDRWLYVQSFALICSAISEKIFEGFFKQKKQYGCRIKRLTMSTNFFVDYFIPRWPETFSYWSDVAFCICNYDAITRHLWHHKKSLIPHEEFLPYAKFQFFLGAVSEVQSFSIFQTWLPHDVTYVIIIIKTFCMSSRTDWWKFRLNPTSGCGEIHNFCADK